MGNKTRVVVTGLGAITPIGNDVASFWQGLKDNILYKNVSVQFNFD